MYYSLRHNAEKFFAVLESLRHSFRLDNKYRKFFGYTMRIPNRVIADPYPTLERKTQRQVVKKQQQQQYRAF